MPVGDVMFTVGLVQFRPVRYDVSANVAAVKRLLEGVRADLLVLPELANSGYMYAAPADLDPYAEAGDGSGLFLSALRRLTEHTGGVIVTGFAERGQPGLYNSAAAVDASGVRQLYRKTHLFQDEQDPFLPGDTGFRIFTHHGVRIGMMVCFDWCFPESARTLALLGAQIIAHPANLVLPWCQSGMVTRCLENAVFAITTNRHGTEELNGKRLTFTGASQILDTKGRPLAQAHVEGDAVMVCEIDPTVADDKRIGTRNDLFGNRRPEMYLDR
jgi:predicted amidohydrolase